DPVRIAEEIALLDILSGGRCLLGFGRGAASVEYAGFRIPMEEARARFVETAQIVVRALSQDVFEWDGEFFKMPRTSGGPVPPPPTRRAPAPPRGGAPSRPRSWPSWASASSSSCRTSGRRPPRTSGATG